MVDKFWKVNEQLVCNDDNHATLPTPGDKLKQQNVLFVPVPTVHYEEEGGVEG